MRWLSNIGHRTPWRVVPSPHGRRATGWLSLAFRALSFAIHALALRLFAAWTAPPRLYTLLDLASMRRPVSEGVPGRTLAGCHRFCFVRRILGQFLSILLSSKVRGDVPARVFAFSTVPVARELAPMTMPSTTVDCRALYQQSPICIRHSSSSSIAHRRAPTTQWTRGRGGRACMTSGER